MLYHPGDVVYCKFPLREDPLQFIPRPALVMKVIDGGRFYKLAQITTTDRRGQQAGIWVDINSNEAKQMRLKNSSFINLSTILKVPDIAIDKFRGTCPLLSKLEQICKQEGINY